MCVCVCVCVCESSASVRNVMFLANKHENKIFVLFWDMPWLFLVALYLLLSIFTHAYVHIYVLACDSCGMRKLVFEGTRVLHPVHAICRVS